MKTRWNDDDRVEYEHLVTECLAIPKRDERNAAFLSGLADAVQAQRIWALDIQNDFNWNGSSNRLKREQNKRVGRVAVANGQVISAVPRVLGVKRRDTAGKVVHDRALFDYMTWDELREKLPFYAQQIEAYERDAHAVIRLLTLQSKVPAAATPHEACRVLGTTIEAYLVDDVAA